MRNEKGFTLVEILAALTILGIVFVGFMTVFPQMTKFNEKTEDKLVTMNLAKQELASIKKVKDLDKKVKDISDQPEISDDKKFYKYNIENDKSGYRCEVEFFTNKAVDGGAKGDTLHKVIIEIYKQDKIVSETFGYIRE